MDACFDDELAHWPKHEDITAKTKSKPKKRVFIVFVYFYALQIARGYVLEELQQFPEDGLMQDQPVH